MPLTGSGRSAKPSALDRQPQPAAPGCQSCREQHLKCDRATPACGRCAANGRECRRGYKFKASKGSFPRSQKWIRSPTKFTYVDETEITARNYESQKGDGNRRPSHATSSGAEMAEHGGDDDEDVPDGPTPVSASATGVSSVTLEDVSPTQMIPPSRQVLVPGSPTDRFIVHEEHHAGIANKRRPESRDGRAATEPQLYLDAPVWPLKQYEQAFLLRHYVQNLATWLDLCDPLAAFQTIVPERAGKCTTLLNAIFALAARHLSYTTPNYDHLASTRYHQICLQTLIPMLKDATTVSDENLFAATIILRVLEEMEVRTVGVDMKGHLLGIHAFVNGDNRRIVPHSLSAAAFWVGLRQEIYSAVMNKQPVRINLGLPIVDRSLSSPAEDHVWANRAVAHCADVLNFCFGDHLNTRLDAQRWSELSEWSRSWQKALPSSFTPLYEAAAADSPFPEIWYRTACQTIGVQHNILADLFLTTYQPATTGVATATTNRFKELVRQLCGIGLSNQWSPPALFTACMGVSVFGNRFESKVDQQAFLGILSKTEKEHARPTEAIQKQMMKAWGWIGAED